MYVFPSIYRTLIKSVQSSGMEVNYKIKAMKKNIYAAKELKKGQGYIFWPARKIPPPLKFFPVFVDFFCGHLSFTCVLSLFSFFLLFPPFPFLFSCPPSNSSLFFNLDKKTWGGGIGHNIYPCLRKGVGK